jgi:hypothetical protein
MVTDSLKAPFFNPECYDNFRSPVFELWAMKEKDNKKNNLAVWLHHS